MTTQPNTWEQIQDIVDSLDGTPTRCDWQSDPWLITADDVLVETELPDPADYMARVSWSLSGLYRDQTLISVNDLTELTEAEIQSYIRALKAWEQDTNRQAREVANALVLQAIYSVHHRPSAALPVDPDEYADQETEVPR